MTKEQEIQRNMKKLGISRKEAEQLYIDDRASEPIPEVKAIEDKAKTQKRHYEKSDKPRAKTTREKTLDFDKVELINQIFTNLAIEDKTIANPQREITFNYNGNNYSITLTKHKRKDV